MICPKCKSELELQFRGTLTTTYWCNQCQENFLFHDVMESPTQENQEEKEKKDEV